MKKILLISICFVLLFTGVIYAKDINQITLNGKVMTFSVDPIMENGITLVPMRTILESLGATVIWNREDKSIYSVKDDINVWLQLENPIAKINDEEVTLAVAPKVVNRTTLVPIRFVTETFGGNVDWDAESKKIIITTLKIPKIYVKPIKKSINEEYNLKISDAKEKLNLLCQQISSELNSENIEQVLTNFRTSIEDKSIDMIYFAKETGGIYLEPYYDFPDDYDARERTWYINTKKEGNYISDTYTDIISGNKIITITKGIYENGKFIGVVGLDLVLEFGE